MRPALAFDHRRIVADQGGKTRPVNGCRHNHNTQVFAQHGLAFQRQRQSQIAVEMALMRFIEQHGGNPGKLRIIQDHIDENRFGNDEHPGF